MRLQLTVLLLVAAACSPACVPGSGPSAGANPHGNLSPVASGGPQPTGASIDRSRFVRQNGEGYSGPDFVFALVPDPKNDNRIAVSKIGGAYDRCMRQGSSASERSTGHVSGLARLLGQVYGLAITEAERERAKAVLRPNSYYLVHPFPPIQLTDSLTGIDFSEDKKSVVVSDLRNSFSLLALLPGATTPEELRIDARLPYFLAMPLEWRFTKEGERFEPFMKGRALFYPGETLRVAEPLLRADGSGSPYVLNTLDVYECMLAESQLLTAEAGREGVLTDDVGSIDHSQWFLSQFAGEYTSDFGRLRFAFDGSLELEARYAIGGARRCDEKFRGKVKRVYTNFEALDHEHVGGSRRAGAVDLFTVKFELSEIYRNGRYQALPPFVLHAPESCELGVSYPITSGWKSYGRNSDRFSVITASWPVTRTGPDGFEYQSEFERSKWKRVGAPIANSEIPRRAPITPATCSLIQPWLDGRWNKALLETKTLEERTSLYRAEYQLRRRVAKAIFDTYFSTGSLDPKIFEDCLLANGERQNFLHTVSAVFWEETLIKLQDLQKKSGSTALARLIEVYGSGKGQRAPPLFRMTGHRASQSDNARVGGVLQGAPALFLNAFALKPDEWMMIWLHEVIHYLDRRLETAIVESDSLGEDLSKAKGSAGGYPADKVERWVKLGLDRTFWAEYRAWLLTFKIYEETKSSLTAPISWLETALSFKGKDESLEDYTFRLLRELNQANVEATGLLEDAKAREIALRVIREELTKDQAKARARTGR